jgi:hypothetical protein
MVIRWGGDGVDVDPLGRRRKKERQTLVAVVVVAARRGRCGCGGVGFHGGGAVWIDGGTQEGPRASRRRAARWGTAACGERERGGGRLGGGGQPRDVGRAVTREAATACRGGRTVLSQSDLDRRVETDPSGRQARGGRTERGRTQADSPRKYYQIFVSTSFFLVLEITKKMKVDVHESPCRFFLGFQDNPSGSSLVCPWQQLAKQHTAQKDSRPVPFRSHTVTAGSTSALPLAPPGRPSRSAATVVPPSHRDGPSTQQGRPRAEGRRGRLEPDPRTNEP